MGAVAKKILVIDDDPLITKTLTKYLKSYGYEIEPVLSGRDAIQKVETSLFDLIIIDIRMPEIDGIETIKRIREIAQNKYRTKIAEIIITGYASEEYREEAERLGVTAYIYKPFDADEFLEAVKTGLNIESKIEPQRLKLKEVSRADNKTLIDDFIKEQGNKNKQLLINKATPIIGWSNTYIPEEILIAAGFLPYRIMGAAIPLSLSKSYLSGNISSHIQSLLECALRGDYKFLDGMIIGASTDATKRLYDAWIRYTCIPFNHLFDIPKIFGENALIHYKESINALIEDIGKHFKVKISEELLKDAILICNETRRLLLKMNNLRKAPNPLVSARQVIEICRLAMTGDKAFFNKELKSLLDKLIPLQEEEKVPYRILLTGSFEDQDWLLFAIEEAGGTVVCEDTCTRLRYFYGLTDENSQPISAIAKRYMEYKVPSAGLVSFERRSSFILETVREFKIDAVIYYILKFDDPYLFEYPDMKDFLDKNNIPVLRIETEHNTSAIGQIKTRLQAFIETLKLRNLKKARADARAY